MRLDHWVSPETDAHREGRACQNAEMIGIRVLAEDDWRLWRDLRLAALAESPDAFGSRLADWQDAGEARWRLLRNPYLLYR